MSLAIAFFDSENAIVVSDGRAVIRGADRYVPIAPTVRKIFRTRSNQLVCAVGQMEHVYRAEQLACGFSGTLTELRQAVRGILDGIDPGKYADGFLDDGAPYGILQTLMIGPNGNGKLHAFHDSLLRDGTRDVGEHDPSPPMRIVLGFTDKIDHELAILDKTLGSQTLTVPVTVDILRNFVSDIERRFPVEVGGEIYVETLTARPVIVLRDSASRADAFAIANGLIKPAHISNQGLGQITQGSALCQSGGGGGGSSGGWTVVATAPIDVPSGTSSIQFTLTVTGTGGGATPGYIYTDIGFAIYSGSAPASPDVSLGSVPGASQSLTLNNPTTGTGLTVALFVYWTSSGAYATGTFSLLQNVMQLFTAGSLT